MSEAYEYVCHDEQQPAFSARSNFVSFWEAEAHKTFLNLLFIVKIIPFNFQALCCNLKSGGGIKVIYLSSHIKIMTEKRLPKA